MIFIVIVTTIAGAPFWAILFFFMMIILGLDTMMASVETTITSILDIFPPLKKTELRKVLTITGICVFFLVVGILFCLQSGTYWIGERASLLHFIIFFSFIFKFVNHLIEIFNSYASGWSVLLVGALESISIAWFYGLNNFKRDISLMLGNDVTDSKFFYIWYVLWFAITPGCLIALVVLSFKDWVPLQVDDYTFPYWSHILGMIMTISLLFGIVFWPAYQLIDVLFINKKVIQ